MSTARNILFTILMLASVALGQSIVGVAASAFNKLAAAVGPISGDAGVHQVAFFRERLTWTLSDVTFNITPQGMFFTGEMNARYGPFPFASRVTGQAQVRYYSGSKSIELAIQSVAVPIIITLPLIGDWTITTVTVNPNYHTYFPVRVSTLRLMSPTGETRHITSLPGEVAVVYRDGWLELKQEVSIW